jgi:hypothetical protein
MNSRRGCFDAYEQMRFFFYYVYDRICRILGDPVVELCHAIGPRFAFHEVKDALVTILSHNRIAFPVP